MTLERDKAFLNEKVALCGRPLQSPDEIFRTTTDFLASPWILWESDDFEERRTVLKLAFSQRIQFHREEGFRTPETAYPFKVLEAFHAPDVKMARRAG